ncbi:GGDEF domain-containing protein [Jeotgalibacillus campisalis]|uniref:Diguanylate cyclase (GGDEF) domain-containing protein n=1 Tax=Jeotgalibacillus campisalis TaxID=220754 RepID=A0A0C2VGW9_9BACL|nr:GGDEF domain-containing protein [Jeotgalibacillus campisalis]KIL43258.1 diguanylate cyclase (GGDEF) domain-containing protein [Jeotgalibacillus campisalis]
MMAYIGEIAKGISCMKDCTVCSEVDDLFQQEPGLQGIVIMDPDKPPALITRTKFYQKMGTRYGYNLYENRPIGLLANSSPLIVDFFASVIEVSKWAMERPDDEVYDDVVVKKDGNVYGAVSIKKLLTTVADIQTELASYLNPLTRLPGNTMIDEHLTSAFEQQKPFTLLYIDLDRFKAYNDSYGFKKGDDLLRETATILRSCFDRSDSFLGHIGGDDFIVIIPGMEYESSCSAIIQQFDDCLRSFYTKEHFQQRFIYTENRSGQLEEMALVAISIAAVTQHNGLFGSVEELVNEATRLKKICKKRSESCFYTEPYMVV